MTFKKTKKQCDFDVMSTIIFLMNIDEDLHLKEIIHEILKQKILNIIG